MKKLKEIFDKVNETLSSIEKDKLLHFIYGLLITMVTTIAFTITMDYVIGIIASLAFIVGVGYGKEYIVDLKIRQEPIDLKDTYATILGGVACIIYFIISTLIQ